MPMTSVRVWSRVGCGAASFILTLAGGLAPAQPGLTPKDGQPLPPAKFPMYPGREVSPIPPLLAPADIEVPEAERKLGVVYTLLWGAAPQVTITAQGKTGPVQGSTNDLRGYVVAGPTEAPAHLQAGRWRFKVTSLRTGDPARDRHLAGLMGLDGPRHPFIELTLSKVTDLVPAELPKTPTPLAPPTNAQAYSGTLEGSLTIRGVTRPLKLAAAKLTMLRSNESTAKIAPGNLLQLGASFSLLLSDFAVPDRALGPDQPVADEIKVTIDLTMSDTPPATPDMIGRDPGARAPADKPREPNFDPPVPR